MNEKQAGGSGLLKLVVEIHGRYGGSPGKWRPIGRDCLPCGENA